MRRWKRRQIWSGLIITAPPIGIPTWLHTNFIIIISKFIFKFLWWPITIITTPCNVRCIDLRIVRADAILTKIDSTAWKSRNALIFQIQSIQFYYSLFKFCCFYETNCPLLKTFLNSLMFCLFKEKEIFVKKTRNKKYEK